MTADEARKKFEIDAHIIGYIEYLIEESCKHSRCVSVFLYPDNDYEVIKEYFTNKGFTVKKAKKPLTWLLEPNQIIVSW